MKILESMVYLISQLAQLEGEILPRVKQNVVKRL